MRGLTDGTGALAGMPTYDVFGTMRTSTGATSRFGYTGEQHDSETGYTILRGRGSWFPVRPSFVRRQRMSSWVVANS